MNGARVLWVVAALLAVGVAAEFAIPTAPKVDPVPVPQIAGAAAAAAAEPYGAWTAAILARPLFNPDRRPTPVAAASATPAAVKQEPPRLTGILVTPVGKRAIFDGGEHATIIGEGGRVGAWQVVAIRAGEVQLDGPEGGRIVRPSYANAPASSAPVAPAASNGLLPPMPGTDTRSFSATTQMNGAAIFTNAPPLPAARTFP